MGRIALLLAGAAAFVAQPAKADFVADWVVYCGQVRDAAASNTIRTPGAKDTAFYDSQVALAMFEALNAIDRRYESVVGLQTAPAGASARAATATAAYKVMLARFPSQSAMLAESYAIALDEEKNADARAKGVAVGEAAAAAALQAGGADPNAKPVSYRPRTAPGIYTSTTLPVLGPWIGTYKPWVLPAHDALRPPPPPALTSEQWARDFEEVKRLGGKSAGGRSAIQTTIARYRSLPDLTPTLVWISDQPGRRPVQNARMFALMAMAQDDTMMAVTDAKLHYNFWRPITAIRNADDDSNPATAPDPDWEPYLNTPAHPEYPCGHCIQASTSATVLAGEKLLPPDGVRFITLSGQAITEHIPTLADYVQTVSDSRIYAGVHYRFSNDAAVEMGKKLGSMTLAKMMRPLKR